jgi:hypothetical protein
MNDVYILERGGQVGAVEAPNLRRAMARVNQGVLISKRGPIKHVMTIAVGGALPTHIQLYIKVT